MTSVNSGRFSSAEPSGISTGPVGVGVGDGDAVGDAVGDGDGSAAGVHPDTARAPTAITAPTTQRKARASGRRTRRV